MLEKRCKGLLNWKLLNLIYFCGFRREVVPKILQSKGRLPGNYLIREHTKKFDWYVLSLIKDDGSFSHFEIQYVEKDGKMMYKLNDQRVFGSLEEMLQFYKDERHRVMYLHCTKNEVFN